MQSNFIFKFLIIRYLKRFKMFNNNQVGILPAPAPLAIAGKNLSFLKINSYFFYLKGDLWMPGSVGLESLMSLDKIYVNNENRKSE
jgi:hypothetical protein